MRLDHLLLGSKDKSTVDGLIHFLVDRKYTIVSFLFVFNKKVASLNKGEHLFCEERKNGGIAQLVEHLPCKQGVIGSNPITSTNMGS